MSNSALKSIVIEHLRGSTQPFILPFDKGKNLTIIYGDNALPGKAFKFRTKVQITIGII